MTLKNRMDTDGPDSQSVDIQDLKADLSAARNMLLLVMDNIPQAIFWKDRHSVFLGCNQNFAKAAGLESPDDIIGLDDYALPWKPEESEFFRECDRRVMESDCAEYHIIEPLLQADGKSVWLDTSKIPLHNADGQVIGILGTYEDITERIEAEQELAKYRDHLELLVEERTEQQRKLESRMRQTQKLESLGVLAGGVAHDFSNLLVGVMGYVDLALGMLPRGSKAASCLQKAMRHSQRAADLCEQMLAYSGKGQFVIQDFDLNDLARDLEPLLATSVPKRTELVVELDESSPIVSNGDVTQIRQILLNLVLNGAEAIGDAGGTLWLRTGSTECDQERLEHCFLPEPRTPGTYNYFEIEDSGCGMDRGTLNKIFDPFFTTKFTGRGLGLAAVLGIVRGHEGTIEIESAVGQGTVFRILLPAAAAQQESAEEDPAPLAAAPWASGRVLVVDDEEAVLTTASFALENAGFEVLCAHDGLEAVDLLTARRDEIDCVLLDLTMPKMDGIETFHRLRQLRDDLPIILSSAYSEEKLLQDLIDRGLSGFLRKPYRTDRLLGQVSEILRAA